MNNIIIKIYVRVSIIMSEYIVLILNSQPNIFFHTKSSNNFLSIFPTLPSCCVISSCKDKNVSIPGKCQQAIKPGIIQLLYFPM